MFRRKYLFLFCLGMLLAAQDDQTGKKLELQQQLSTRIAALTALPKEEKGQLAKDLQSESTIHFGVNGIRNVDELSLLKPGTMTFSQLANHNATTMHVVDAKLVPIAVTSGGLRPSEKQIYPDLEQAVERATNPTTEAMTKSVGRLRYWVRTTGSSADVKESDAQPAGTAFVVAPNV
jgi:hypothetical protein